jgi:pyruvate/2-oxoglutarate dehydrogenase complex dihydrolipoamide dehydrogenase (E3) component
VGAELAIYLSMLGKKVRLVEMAPALNTGGNFLHGRAVEAQLGSLGVDILFNTTAARIDSSGVWCRTQEGERYIEGETVICAVGQTPLTDEAAALYGCAPRFYPLGDCIVPRSIGEATAAAATIARDLGRY